MSVLRPLAPGARRAQRWANGRGSTLELDRDSAGEDWRWRLSVAQVDADGPFSPYPDTRRLLAPLDAPLTLAFAGGREHRLPRLATFAFDGADAPQAGLPEGPTRVVNLMLRGAAQGELIARPLHGLMLLPATPGWRWFVHLLAGHAEVHADGETRALQPDESLWLDPRPGQRLLVDGGGELVLVKLFAP
ncbi:HutD/Ves family protein [Frateuria defendens]|uniref:HutD/Ves family protein n=1 Tax=Frateuria defendens TaxID=2219559 RepID=UPI00066FFCF5|nr:HutD family protein [Frateuria defendens]